ncbi:MAG TPA: AAA family ATPase, partial [Verrucomicrobiae bacterium]|nr:AAA family ATPase [Verrucomicrobiae bacterium]
MRISRISAQAFRGFPNEVHFSLSKAVTVIQAPNGFGKTSLSEAFEWTLYGEVARKVRSKTKAEFGQEFLRSVHADQADETWAEVELIKPDGNKLVIRRTMIKGGDNKLEADGKIIDSIEAVGISTGLSSRPCLGQSEIKAFIDTEPKERWKQISAILGLGDFEVVREKLMKLKTDTDRDATVMQIRESARRAVAPLAPEGVDPLGQDPEALLLQLVAELSLPADTDWDVVQETAEKKITDLLSSDKKPASLDQMVTGVEEILDD